LLKLISCELLKLRRSKIIPIGITGGAIYPWTATFFLVQGKIESTCYPTVLSAGIILLLSTVGFFMTYHHFKKEDLK
jgi:hypothetical protein